MMVPICGCLIIFVVSKVDVEWCLSIILFQFLSFDRNRKSCTSFKNRSNTKLLPFQTFNIAWNWYSKYMLDSNSIFQREDARYSIKLNNIVAAERALIYLAVKRRFQYFMKL